MSKTKCFGIASAVALMSLGLPSSIDAQQAQTPNLSFFIATGLGKGGDLGGINGADARCQQLATAVGAGNKVWRAYLSTSANGGSINARDRIGKGPWQNSKGTVIATSVEDLHSDKNKLDRENSLTERGGMVSGFGMTPNWHDVLTGSTMEGRAWPGNMALTCNNWTSSGFGSAMLGHIDRRGGADTVFQKSWNSAHQSRACSQDDLIATGGNGMFYCFATE